MNPRTLLITVYFCCGLVAGRLVAAPPVEEYLPRELTGAWEGRDSGEPRPEVAVSLRELERQARASKRRGLLTIGDLTDVTGASVLPDGSDVLILGTRGDPSVEPILVGELVTALRVGEHFYMSLDPVGGMDRHQLRFGPEPLAGTSFLAGLTRADYFVKAMALGLVEAPLPEAPALTALYGCQESPLATEVTTQNNVFFEPGKFAWDASADRRTFRFTDFTVVLSAGAGTGSLQRDFVTAFNQHNAAVVAAHPRVFKRLHNLFKLHQIAYLLTLLAASFDELDLGYWLEEFRAPPQVIPTRFPGFEPQRFATFCRGRSGISERVFEIRGGVLSRWTSPVPGFAARTSTVFASDATVLALRADMRFVRKQLRPTASGETFRGTYSWAADGALRLVPDAGEPVIMTRDSSQLLAADGTRLSMLFEPTVKTPEGAPPLADAASPHSVESDWLRHNRQAASLSRQEQLRVEQPVERTEDERQVLRQIEDLIGKPRQPEGPVGNGIAAPVTHGPTAAAQRVVEALVVAAGDLSALARISERVLPPASAPAGAGNPGSALAYVRLVRLAAEQCRAASRVADALTLGGHALSVLDRLGARETADYADVLALLGAVYSATGDYRRGEGMLREATQLFARVGAGDQRRALALYALGDHEEALGRHEAAIASYRSGVAMLRALPASDPQWIAAGIGSIAWSLLEGGDLEQARQVTEEALAIVAGQGPAAEPEPHLVEVLAAVLYGAEEHEAAVALLEPAVARASRDAEGNPLTLASLSNDLGLAYWSLGRKREAKEALGRAVGIHESAALEYPAARTRALINYGSILVADRRFREAEALLEQGVLLAREVLGEAHPDHVRGLQARAYLERSRGRWKEEAATQTEIARLAGKANRRPEDVDFPHVLAVLDSLWSDRR